MKPSSTDPRRLRREVGLFGAVMMGLGSIVGTGVFVSLGVAAGVAGPAVLLAVGIGALVASFNGLSSAQLAANHPVSGGTYEYGYRYLTPRLGFLAGWAFLLAKSASAATAALGFAGYAMGLFGGQGSAGAASSARTALALALVIALTLLVLAGIRRSNLANIVIVTVTLASLAMFVVAGLPTAAAGAAENLRPFFQAADNSPLSSLLYASALMFVAFTGYGRIATLGEEVKEPRRVIPRAIVVTVLVVLLLYLAVGFVALAAGDLSSFAGAGESAASLVVVARGFEGRLGSAAVPTIVAVGAVTAMAGVLLNLVLGLSRVLLAMGRRRDMPAAFGRLDATGSTPVAAVIAVGLAIGALVLIGDVRLTWSFSAFTVLVYYSLTNLAALRLPTDQRLFPRWVAAFGLAGCLLLAVFVEPRVLLAGAGALLAGLLWQALARRLVGRRG